MKIESVRNQPGPIFYFLLWEKKKTERSVTEATQHKMDAFRMEFLQNEILKDSRLISQKRLSDFIYLILSIFIGFHPILYFFRG